MSKLKILIVEDEMITAESISDMLEDLGYQVIGICMRAEKALEKIRKEQPDFALLDIQLKGEKTGIWLAEQIRESYQFPFIFLTSYGDKKTIEDATKTAPYGYILKPVEKQHLYAGIEVALRKYAELNKSQDPEGEEESIFMKDALFVRDEYMFVKVNYADIRYIKSNGNYLELHLPEKMYMIKGSMQTFAGMLPEGQFLQSHRSYIANLKKIDAFGGNYLCIGDDNIPITTQNKEEMMRLIQLYQK